MPNPDNPGTERVGPLLSHLPHALTLHPEYASMKMEAFLSLKIISVLTWKTRSLCFSGSTFPKDKVPLILVAQVIKGTQLGLLGSPFSLVALQSLTVTLLERRRHDWENHLLSWSGSMCFCLLQVTNVGEHSLDLVPEREVLSKVPFWFRAHQPA